MITKEAALELNARHMAHSLGISVYIRDGRIHQHGPGIEIMPPESAKIAPHESDVKKPEASGPGSD